MQAIVKALSEIHYRIPGQILKEVFSPKFYAGRNTPVSLDEQITHLVIKPRVLVDCNLVGGAEIFVSLDGLPVQQPNDFTAIFHIPRERTQGRSIISALSVGYTSPSLAAASASMGGVQPSSNTPVMGAAMAMMDSYSPIPVTSTAKVQLIAENTVMIRDVSPIMPNGYLRCVIGNDDNMSHLQLRSIPQFCKLAELAVKAFIYNESVINIDMAKLTGGLDLGKYKEIVDSYNEAETMYEEYLEKTWSKVSFFNDRETFQRHLRLYIGAMR